MDFVQDDGAAGQGQHPQRAVAHRQHGHQRLVDGGDGELRQQRSVPAAQKGVRDRDVLSGTACAVL